MSKEFDPKQHLIKIGVNKDGTPRWYLQTAHRVLWFRTEHPIESNWSILTEPVQLDPFPVFKAIIVSPEGVTIASGYGSAQTDAKTVYSGREIEKAETAAIGRALGLAGFGTQFDADDEGEHLADSPQERRPVAKSNWTKAEARAWVAARESTGWTRERLKAALGIEYFTDFDGVEDDADMRLTEYKARLDAEDDTRRAAYELAARMEAADPVDAPDPFADDDKPMLGKDEATRLTKWAYKETKMNVSRLCGILNVKNADEFRGTYDDAVAKVEEWRALVNGRQPATLETAVQQS